MSGQDPADVRVATAAAWSAPVTEVRFVDAGRAKALAKLGVATVGGLLRHYPNRHLDLTATPDLADVRQGQDVTVVGRVHEVRVKRPRPRLTVVEVGIVDGTGVLLGVWFNQPYIADRFREGVRVAFAGRVTLDYGLRQIKNPFVEILGDDDETRLLGQLIPMHPTTEGLSANWLRRLVYEAIEQFGDVPDPLPAEVRLRRGLVRLTAAVRDSHFPGSHEALAAAKRRLAYEEFFFLQLLLHGRRLAARTGDAVRHVTDGKRLAAVREALGFTLTADQEVAAGAVLEDMASDRPMNRLLLGDVGTGKTAVAALALAAATDGGNQAAMMAPTEVLARQYAEHVGPSLDAAGIAWALLTGSTPAKERREMLERLAAGELEVLFGTHALFSTDVGFDHLGLAVVDEQHRFGVEQRLALREKGPAADLLVMSATPIPRSLALTAFGDLDTSYLRERPSGRDPADVVTTRVVHADERSDAYDAVRSAAAAGHQTYVICPLVEESADADAKAATDEAERLGRDIFPDLAVGLLTGRMSSEDKAGVMDAFRAGDLDVLVATTVVEVGVDVPNATVMIVEDAERFGLAQLHQLRGRVGRGSAAGSFMLFADPNTEDGARRMAAIETVSDGFELAEIDLELRGEGDVLGQRQSGVGRLLAASLVRDRDLLEAAREDVIGMTGEAALGALPVLAPALAAARARFPEFDEGLTDSG